MTNAEFLDQIRDVILQHGARENRKPALVAITPPFTSQHLNFGIQEQVEPHQMNFEKEQQPPLNDSAVSSQKMTADRSTKRLDFSESNSTLHRKTSGVRAQCQQWLANRLSNGPLPLAQIREEAIAMEFSPKALRVARKHLKIRPVQCLTLPTLSLANY